MLFEHDTLRVAAAWTGQGFIDWNGVQFNGRHAVHPRLVGDVHFALPTGPGWADPQTGKFDDPRLRGRDGKPYGPLPRKWGRYLGLYHHGQRVVVAYTVGDAKILETFAGERGALASRLGVKSPAEFSTGGLTPPARQSVVFTRTLNISKSSHDLLLRVAAEPAAVAVVGSERAKVESKDGFVQVRIPAGATPLRLKLLSAKPQAADLAEYAKRSPPPEDLEPLTHGGPRRWTDWAGQLTQPVLRGREDGPFAVDVLMHPEKNPWQCQIRCTGLDFYPDGKRLALCTWDGDVWLVSGLDNHPAGLTWQRIASGLFQPLGLKIIDGKIHLTCRDQLVRLHDLNGDGETDFYECVNSDHQVTEHFHEFAMGLQTDAEGNFYYAKSARHALPALVPHHGTLLKVSKDGSRTDILATGFRAANGVCLNPDGTFFVTDQEGHWTPKNRINWVGKDGGFFGNMFGYHDVTDKSDTAMEQPVCWITNAFDRSPAELLWVTSERWGPLKGSLLNLSYGYGQIYVVPHEIVGGRMQGGMATLPLPRFPTGIMRGRFHPVDGQLYVCGMFSWAGNQMQPGGLYRVRRTGKPVYLPLALHAKKGRIAVTFSGELDAATPLKTDDIAVKTWSLKRTENYGSEHHNERRLLVSRATVASDGKTLLIELPDLRPTMGMEIRYTLRGKDGQVVDGVIHNTIHALGE